MKENAMVEAKLFFLLSMINEFSIWLAELWTRTGQSLFSSYQVNAAGLFLFVCKILYLLI